MCTEYQAARHGWLRATVAGFINSFKFGCPAAQLIPSFRSCATMEQPMEDARSNETIDRAALVFGDVPDWHQLLRFALASLLY
jgi:hypothetical protein